MDRVLAKRALVGGVGLGVAAQGLFLRLAPGVNVFCIVAATIALGALIVGPGRFDRADWWLPLSSLGLAAFIAIRADGGLLNFDLAASLALALASLAAMAGARVSRRSASTISMLVAVASGVVAVGAALSLALVRPWSRPVSAVRRQPQDAAGFGRGVLIAVPILVLFGGLFASADAVFGRLVDQVLSLNLDLGDLPDRAAYAVVAAWFGTGALMVVAAWELWDREATRAREAFASPFRLGRPEARVVLWAVDVLFALFVALQIAYLFGGRDTLAASGMTYSDYARRGFFELVAATVLSLFLVVTIEALVDRTSGDLRLAGLCLIVLTGGVLVSAMFRLRLYQDAYGWTELRFYVFATIIWLAMVLGGALVLLIPGRTRWLPQLLGSTALLVLFASTWPGRRHSSQSGTWIA